MTLIKTILASATLGITLATGIALAQGYQPQLFGRPDPELRAARESLDDALAHLRRARNSDTVFQTRDVERAMAAIDPNFNSFAAPVAPPLRRVRQSRPLNLKFGHYQPALLHC